MKTFIQFLEESKEKKTPEERRLERQYARERAEGEAEHRNQSSKDFTRRQKERMLSRKQQTKSSSSSSSEGRKVDMIKKGARNMIKTNLKKVIS
tara:strand:+ start:128 stop:409 length:282 start_codon:yes stop_codon:yes gene_type:complete